MKERHVAIINHPLYEGQLMICDECMGLPIAQVAGYSKMIDRSAWGFSSDIPKISAPCRWCCGHMAMEINGPVEVFVRYEERKR